MDRRNENQHTGRLPEVYYKRRRAAAVVALLVVVFLVIWLLSALGNKSDQAQPETAPAVDTTAASVTGEKTSSAASSQSTSSSSASESASESASQEPSASTTAKASEKTSCTLDDLEVTASTNNPNYVKGAKPTFYMTVKNPTKADCAIDLGENVIRFEVYGLATNQRIWSDIDCNQPMDKGKVTIKPGETLSYEAVWARTKSAPKQCQNRPKVEAGGYFLHAVVGSKPSPAYTFNIAS